MRGEIAGEFEAGAVALRKTGLELRDVGPGTADSGVEALIVDTNLDACNPDGVERPSRNVHLRPDDRFVCGRVDGADGAFDRRFRRNLRDWRRCIDPPRLP